MPESNFARPARAFCVAIENGTSTYRHGYVRNGAPRARSSSRDASTSRFGATDDWPRLDASDTCSATQVVVELDRAHRRKEIAPWIPLASVVVLYVVLMAALGFDLAGLYIALVVLTALGALAALYGIVLTADRSHGTVHLYYTLDDEATARFVRLQRGLRRLAVSHRVWHVPSEGRVAESARQHGAKLFLRKYRIRPNLSTPPKVRSNVRVPSLYSESRKYYFFPDRVLVYGGGGVHSLPYQLLSMRGGQSLCIEDEEVPSDARVVETTWLHAMPDGSPDPRFPSNRRYPVAVYGDLEFAGPGGVRELFQCSQPDAVADFVAAVEAIAFGEDWFEADVADEIDDEEEAEAGAEEPDDRDDDMYEEALRAVVRVGYASIDVISDEVGVEYGRAAMILATMERDGFVGPSIEGKPRVVNRSAVRYVTAAYGNGAKAHSSTSSNGRRTSREKRRERASSRRSRSRSGARGPARTPHEVLGVRENASPEEISDAYHDLAQMYHPDKVATLAHEFRELAELRMKELNEAYRSLRSRR